MGKHSKNAGGMGTEAMTYHERKALGYGTRQERLSKDTMGNFDDCSLTLQPATDPVCTPQGYLYSKVAIIENLLEQKKAIRRTLVSWEAQQAAQQHKETELAAAADEARLLAFDRQNHMGASTRLAEELQSSIQAEAANQLHNRQVVNSAVNIKTNEARIQELKAFWLPSKTPEAEAKVDKPDSSTYCPASGRKLRMKDLIPVNFTPVPEGETGRYMDPVTRDTFTNKSKLVVLKPTGDVVLEATYEKCIKPEGSYKGVPIKARDVIKLQRGGTGFAAHDGDKLKSEKYWALGPGNGRADQRGQMAAGRSLGGLVFMN